MALASPRVSAQIIPLPGATATPVVNPARRPSYNKTVRPIKLGQDARRLRLMREADAAREAAKQQAWEARRKSPIRDAFCAAFAVAVNGLPLEDLKEVTELMVSRMSPSLKLEMHGG